jgi:transcriptional regulator with XRE-family HTH domain
VTDASDLAGLLKSWRARIKAADVGFPPATASRRTPGLRREELAWLSGISPDYIKRLEQGRAHPSAAVLGALSRALQVSDAEYELACRLAGHSAERRGQVPQQIGASVRRLLDRFRDVPIAVFDAAWTLLEHNELWTALHGDFFNSGDWSANLVWRYFLGGPVRVRHALPEEFEQSLVADLRDVSTRYPTDRRLTDLIRTLRSQSPEFAQLWRRSTVAHHSSERKIIDHPAVGELELDCDVLSVHGAELRVIVFTAPPESEAAGKLRLLNVLGAQITDFQ